MAGPLLGCMRGHCTALAGRPPELLNPLLGSAGFKELQVIACILPVLNGSDCMQSQVTA